MSKQSTSIQFRLARHDELGTILNWLDDSTLLAATNTPRMNLETRSNTRNIIGKRIVDKSLWIVVRDNFRIGAVFSDSYSPNTNASKYPIAQNSKSIYIYTKTRLDWALLSSTVSEVWSKQILNSTHASKIMRLTLSGANFQSNHNGPYGIKQNSIETNIKADTNRLTTVKKIRILGPKVRNESIRKKLCEQCFDVIVSPDPYDANSVDDFAPDIILSSGYDRLLSPMTVQKYSRRIVNLHAAYLPWARGIGTTLFATMLRYPYGVSVHFINEGLDTGDLVARKLVQTERDDTLRTLYVKLLSATEDLFFECFPKILSGQILGVPQEELGKTNTSRSRLQFESVMDVCPNGYDTLITDLEKLRDSLEASNAFRNALLTNSDARI